MKNAFIKRAKLYIDWNLGLEDNNLPIVDGKIVGKNTSRALSVYR